MKKEAIRVTTAIPAAATTLYLAWLDSAQHSAMTGGTAKIDPTVGAKFSAWNGYITGKLVTLDLGRRIVMAWRTSDFPREASDSRVEVHFEGVGSGTRLTILHSDIPEGQGEKYREGWNASYFTPMRNYFSKYLPDPRNPPVRRPPPPVEQEDEEPPMPKGRMRPPLAKGSAAKIAAKPPPKPAKPAKAPEKPEKPKAAQKPAQPAKLPAKATKSPPKKAAKPAPAKKKPLPAAKKTGSKKGGAATKGAKKK